MTTICEVLRSQCGYDWKDSKAFGLEEPQLELQSLIHSIIVHRHSESALLVGASGTGKTMILNSVLESEKQQMKDPKQIKIIELNGLLHNEPKIACQEILDQILDQNEKQSNQGSSFDETGEIVLKEFKSQKKIFFLILNEFDLFATLQRGKQSLLYFLFDMLHHKEIILGIIGKTNRLDCISLLEKRVISRFSQIQIRFFPPDNLVQFLSFIQHRLTISKQSIKENNLDKEKVKQYNLSVQVS